MNKNTIIGLLLIGVVLFGYSWYESNRTAALRQQQRQEAVKEYATDAAVEAWDSLAVQKAAEVENAGEAEAHFKDAALNASAVKAGNTNAVKVDTAYLENDKLRIAFTTLGACPVRVNIKEFKAYGKDSLIFMSEGKSFYNVEIPGTETILTEHHNFQIVDSLSSASELVMRLPVAEGYIQQKYTLREGSYSMDNELSFHDLGDFLNTNSSEFGITWNMDVPRLEKAFKNEKQYSKMNICAPGDKPETVGKAGVDGDENSTSMVKWFAFNQQFFSAIMTSEDSFTHGNFKLRFSDGNQADSNLMSCYSTVYNTFKSDRGNSAYNYEFYFGPNDYRVLEAYNRNYENTITIGGKFIGWITRYVIIPVFRWLSKGISNYGLIILLLTLLIKLVISPLTIKSYMSSAKMNALRPELDKLNEKYPKAATDQKEAMKKQQATMELYRRAGVSPMGGCLPMLLQFPILWAMFRFFPSSIELRQQSFLWAGDLSTYDDLIHFPPIIFGMDHISIFALLMAVSMFFYSKISMPQSNDPQMKPMRFMSVYLMPVMMFFICNSLPAALSYYYLLSNLVTMLQTFVIKKWIVKPEKVLAQIEANKNKPMKKSRFMQRLEEAQKMAEAQQRNARRR